jgi:uncharacterized protein
MKPQVVIFGANGFLGRYLSRHYALQGREVVCIARTERGWSGDGMFLEWDGCTLGSWGLALEGAEMVINLCGASVNCRYDEKNRRRILDSRVETTRLIGQAIAACRIPPRLWMNASTATFYRHAEDAPQNEWQGEPGTGFSVSVARAWEEAFYAIPTPGQTRKVALRTGMVLAREPGTVLERLFGLVRHGLGGAMGDGNQRVSWIHMEDWLAALDFIADQPFFDGVINLTAPEFPTNREWMRALREQRAMPIYFPAPRWVLEMGARLMHTETELVLKSRWAEPARLKNEGFRWRWGHLAEALADLDGRVGLEGFFHQPERRPIGVSGWVPQRHAAGLEASEV